MDEKSRRGVVEGGLGACVQMPMYLSGPIRSPALSYRNLAMLEEAREYNAYCKYDRSEKAPRDRCASAKAWALD